MTLISGTHEKKSQEVTSSVKLSDCSKPPACRRVTAVQSMFLPKGSRKKFRDGTICFGLHGCVEIRVQRPLLPFGQRETPTGLGMRGPEAPEAAAYEEIDSSRLRGRLMAAVFAILLSHSSLPGALAQSSFPQPGFDAQNTGRLPYPIPQSNPPSSSYPLASIFSGLSPDSSAPWVPLNSPVVDQSGTAYWALINDEVGIKLVSVPIATPPTIRASLDISSDRFVDQFSSRAKSAFLSLGSENILLLMFQVNGRILAFLTSGAESIRGSYSTRSSNVSKFDPVMSDSGAEAFVVSQSDAGLPCIFRISLSSGQAECRDIGLGGNSPLFVRLGLDELSNLLITVDGIAIKTPFSDLPVSGDRGTFVARNTPGDSQLRTVPGRSDVIASIGLGGTVSLLNTTDVPWQPIWWSRMGMSNFGVAIDSTRGWIYLCVGAASDDPATEGRLSAIRLTDGQLGWNGGTGVVPCSKDGVLLSSDGSILTVSQSGTISLLNIDVVTGDASIQWSTGIPPQNPITNFPVLAPAVWSRGGNQFYIFSGATAIGFSEFPPPSTTSTSILTSTSSSVPSFSSTSVVIPTSGSMDATLTSGSALPTETISRESRNEGLTGTNLVLAIALPLLALILIAVIIVIAWLRRRRLEGEKPPSEPPYVSSRNAAPPKSLDRSPPLVGSGVGIAGISSVSSYSQEKPKNYHPTRALDESESTLLAAGVVGSGTEASAVALPAVQETQDDDVDRSSFKSALAEDWNDSLATRRESALTVASDGTVRSPPLLPSLDAEGINGDLAASIPMFAIQPAIARFKRRSAQEGQIPSPPDDLVHPTSGTSSPELYDPSRDPPSPATIPSLPRSTATAGISRSRATSPSSASVWASSSSGYAASVSSGATPRPRQSLDRLSRNTSPRNSMQSLDRSSRRSTADSDFWDAPVNVTPLVPLPIWHSDDEEKEEDRWRNLVYGDRRQTIRAAALPNSNTDAETFVTVPEGGSRSDRSRFTPSQSNNRETDVGEQSIRGRNTSETENEAGYVTAGTSVRSAAANIVSDGYVTAREESRSDIDSGTDGYQTGREA
ncbi:hypothetical protein HDU67_005036 [Dinochytrium kinnereticum]|nr:hypothetical protein HDU67_005036 [Dinochytrium kinnereticum]